MLNPRPLTRPKELCQNIIVFTLVPLLGRGKSWIICKGPLNQRAMKDVLRQTITLSLYPVFSAFQTHSLCPTLNTFFNPGHLHCGHFMITQTMTERLYPTPFWIMKGWMLHREVVSQSESSQAIPQQFLLYKGKGLDVEPLAQLLEVTSNRLGIAYCGDLSESLVAQLQESTHRSWRNLSSVQL